jgi:ribose 5-phosphate isomerase A
MSADEYKRLAAEKALTFVEPGMKLGLGTGSTAAKFIDLLGAKMKAGLDVLCVATSEATRAQAEALGLTLTTLDDHSFLDLTIDGADEIDGDLRLIKGGGGALLREKIVATASDRMIVIADTSKKVDKLGRFPLPVEVVRFGFKSTLRIIETLAEEAGCSGEIRVRNRADGAPFLTDGGNLILDCAFGGIEDPDSLADALQIVPGVVEHGLFLDIADAAIIAGPAGIEVIEADAWRD